MTPSTLFHLPEHINIFISLLNLFSDPFEAFIIFSIRHEIRRIDLHKRDYSLLVPGLRNTIALDFHFNQSLLYWTDVVEDRIYRGKLSENGGTSMTILTYFFGLISNWKGQKKICYDGKGFWLIFGLWLFIFSLIRVKPGVWDVCVWRQVRGRSGDACTGHIIFKLWTLSCIFGEGIYLHKKMSSIY